MPAKQSEGIPPAVDRDTFQAALDALLVREKAHTHEGDAIAAARRRLPMVQVDPANPLIGADGPVTLLDAFEGRRQLIAYYFMWHAGNPAPEQCEGCTWVTGRIAALWRTGPGRCSLTSCMAATCTSTHTSPVSPRSSRSPRSARPSSSATGLPRANRRRAVGFRKPADIIDRDAVWQALTAAWESAVPELLFGLGRRRAGKSWVLARFANVVSGIYYQATRRTEAEQLAAISRIVGRHYSDRALTHGVAFPHWEALFAYLADRAGGTPFLLVLDEFPYLAEAAPALTSIIQDTWDHRWPGTRAKLVLNGSHVTAMKRLGDADQPLYGRRTGRIQFPLFHVEDVRVFVPTYGARDVLLTYGAFGGLPGHLALLKPAHDVAVNITRLMLDPGGRLADEAERMLDAFLGDADVHYSIIQAIAGGDRTWSRITSRLGKPSGSLSRPMRWLEEMQVVSRMVPVTENPKTSKRTLYRITDPYVAFWHRFIAPLQASGEMSLASPDALWRGRVAPGLDDYMGPPFEDACRSWVARSTRMPFRPSRIGAWWDATSRNEIDVVALGPNNEVLVGECKWGLLSDQDLATFRARTALMLAELPAAYQGAQVHYACFSGRGEWGDGIAREIAAGSVLGFTAEALLSL